MVDARPKDRYGLYSLLTGLEEPGRCFWCGIEVDARRRYCCEEHRTLYWETFAWAWASQACRRRQNELCGDCGKRLSLEVHHIIPLPDSHWLTRAWNVLNRPENLIALCLECHLRRHAILRAENPKEPRMAWAQELESKGQMVMPLERGAELCT